MKSRYLGLSMSLVLALTSAAMAAHSGRRAAALPADTVLKVKLDNTVGSDRSHRGDRFTATVDDPALPRGARVEGVVLDVRKASKNHSGQIGLDFRTLTLPGGRRVAMAGSPASLDASQVKRAGDGRLVAKSHSSKNTGKYVAYGAAGGLLIGSMMGKNVVGALVGAGAGYLLGQKKDKQAANREVVLKRGTELGVRLDRRVTLARR
jgi:hypothetical protein